jgi:hypothetical protein
MNSAMIYIYIQYTKRTLGMVALTFFYIYDPFSPFYPQYGEQTLFLLAIVLFWSYIVRAI